MIFTFFAKMAKKRGKNAYFPSFCFDFAQYRPQKTTQIQPTQEDTYAQLYGNMGEMQAKWSKMGLFFAF